MHWPRQLQHQRWQLHVRSFNLAHVFGTQLIGVLRPAFSCNANFNRYANCSECNLGYFGPSCQACPGAHVSRYLRSRLLR